MAHYKKRKRRKNGIKGCCILCSLRSTDGRRNGRKLKKQEVQAVMNTEDHLIELGLSDHRLRTRRNF